MTIPARPGCYEFFAGGGMAGLGLSGFERLFANDLDPMKIAAFEANHGAGSIRRADVWELTPADLPGHAALIWASPPCQDVSLAGHRVGLDGARSGAFWGFWRLIEGLVAEERAPSVVVIENVMGLLSSNGGEDFRAIGRAMVEAGYRWGALELDAADWTPQSRPRLFIVAARDPLDGAADLAKGHGLSPLIRAAHAALSEDLCASWRWWSLPPPPRRNVDLSAILEPDDRADWLPAATQEALLALLSPLHRRRLEAARTASLAGPRQVAAGYRRVRIEQGRKTQRLELRFDGLAGCLRTAAGGSSRQFIVVCDDGDVRARRLSPREAARLMGLPDDWVLPRGETAAMKLLGDGVAVPVVRALSEGLLEPLLGVTARRVA